MGTTGKTAQRGRRILRVPGVKILDMYIFREFLISLVAVVAFCALLLLIASVFEKLQEILDAQTSLRNMAAYFLCSLPFKVMQAVPIASMLAVMFSVGALARHNEILALMTSGVHVMRIAAPVVFGGILVATASFYVNETVVPPLEEKAVYYEQLMEGKEERRVTTQRDVFVRGGRNRFYLTDYQAAQRRMVSTTVIDVAPGYSTIVRRINADSASFVSANREKSESAWTLSKPRIWNFDETGNLLGHSSNESDVTVLLEGDLLEMLEQRKHPEAMNYAELARHVQMLARRGQPVHEYRTDLFQKITFPGGILIVMLIGFSVAVRARAANAMQAFGRGVFWAFAYYAFMATTKALGHSGTMSPLLAGILPLGVFLVIATYYVRKSTRWYS